MKRQTQEIIKKMIISNWNSKGLSIPTALFKYYKKLGLNENELMFYLHILNYQQTENNLFPSINDLMQRMSINEAEIRNLLQRLVTSGYLKIEDYYDKNTGIRHEIYNTELLMEQLSSIWIHEEGLSDELDSIFANKFTTEKDVFSSIELLKGIEESDVFTIFEQEFGRPLSPIECERIVKWLDEDNISKELIIEALRQAVLLNKFSMKYIDKILFVWKKNNIRTIHEANEASNQFHEQKSIRSTNKKRSINNTKKYDQDDKELWYWLNIDSQEGR